MPRSQWAPKALLAGLVVISVSLKVVAASSLPPRPRARQAKPSAPSWRARASPVGANAEDIDLLTRLRACAPLRSAPRRRLPARLAPQPCPPARGARLRRSSSSLMARPTTISRSGVPGPRSTRRASGQILGLDAATKPVLAVRAAPAAPANCGPGPRSDADERDAAATRPQRLTYRSRTAPAPRPQTPYLTVQGSSRMRSRGGYGLMSRRPGRGGPGGYRRLPHCAREKLSNPERSRGRRGR